MASRKKPRRGKINRAAQKFGSDLTDLGKPFLPEPLNKIASIHEISQKAPKTKASGKRLLRLLRAEARRKLRQFRI